MPSAQQPVRPLPPRLSLLMHAQLDWRQEPKIGSEHFLRIPAPSGNHRLGCICTRHKRTPVTSDVIVRHESACKHMTSEVCCLHAEECREVADIQRTPAVSGDCDLRGLCAARSRNPPEPRHLRAVRFRTLILHCAKRMLVSTDERAARLMHLIAFFGPGASALVPVYTMYRCSAAATTGCLTRC